MQESSWIQVCSRLSAALSAPEGERLLRQEGGSQQGWEKG